MAAKHTFPLKTGGSVARTMSDRVTYADLDARFPARRLLSEWEDGYLCLDAHLRKGFALLIVEPYAGDPAEKPRRKFLNLTVYDFADVPEETGLLIVVEILKALLDRNQVGEMRKKPSGGGKSGAPAALYLPNYDKEAVLPTYLPNRIELPSREDNAPVLTCRE